MDGRDKENLKTNVHPGLEIFKAFDLQIYAEDGFLISGSDFVNVTSICLYHFYTTHQANIAPHYSPAQLAVSIPSKQSCNHYFYKLLILFEGPGPISVQQSLLKYMTALK